VVELTDLCFPAAPNNNCIFWNQSASVRSLSKPKQNHSDL